MSIQDFPIIYKDNTYFVDPIKLSNSSKKFHDLIQPYLHKPAEIGKIYLKINYDVFSDRNIENFLKLCQNIPTNCQNSEIEEICEIAKMFQADQIYNTGAKFVVSNINPNFNVPDNKYDDDNKDQQFLVLSQILKKAHHFSNIDSLEFEDDENIDYNTNQENLNPNIVADSEKVSKKIEKLSVIYRVRITQPLMKRPIIQFMVNNKVIYSAKHKDNIIVVGKGPNVHLNKDRSNHVCKISMETGGVNNVSCENQQFRVKYVYLNGPQLFSIETEFSNRGTRLHWKPKQPKFNNTTNSYTFPLYGEYNHQPMKSLKNTVLTNDNDEWTFIVRKMANQDFEVECNQNVSQIIIFALALSQLIGPDNSYSNIVKYIV